MNQQDMNTQSSSQKPTIAYSALMAAVNNIKEDNIPELPYIFGDNERNGMLHDVPVGTTILLFGSSEDKNEERNIALSSVVEELETFFDNVGKDIAESKQSDELKERDEQKATSSYLLLKNAYLEAARNEGCFAQLDELFRTHNRNAAQQMRA